MFHMVRDCINKSDRVILVGFEYAAREGRNYSMSMATSGPHTSISDPFRLFSSQAADRLLTASEVTYRKRHFLLGDVPD